MLNSQIVYHLVVNVSGDNGYVAFQIEGNPVPTVEWFKVFDSFTIHMPFLRLYPGSFYFY